jgi:hypothetical protein
VKRRCSDYHAYYWAQCKKLAPRTLDFDHHAYESVLALLMFDYPQKTESECVIALAKMELYAPLVGPREATYKR